MANRIIPTEEKVNIMAQCLTLEGVEEAAIAHGVSPGAIYYWFNEKVLPALSIILANEKPGPKPANSLEEKKQSTTSSASPRSLPQDGRPEQCPECGSARVWKNGLYWVLDWVSFLCFGWFTGGKVPIQRHRCADCGYEIPSPERLKLAEARRKGWSKLRRLVAFSKFKLGLSHRKTQLLTQFVYGKQLSITFVNDVTQTLGQRAKEVISKLADCRQKAARILMGDETFPKIIDRDALRAKAKSVGVVICEFGLIRGIKSVANRSWHMKQLFQGAIGKHFQPQFFLSDYQVHYPKIVRLALEGVRHLKDFVHTLRIVDRYFNEAVRDVTLDVPKGLALKERRKQRKLKKRLLRKQLKPMLLLFFKAFAPGYESVAFIYIEGALSRLEDPSYVIQNESVKVLHRKLTKFFNKHGETLAFQLEQKALNDLVSTSNALESKQSIFKPFSRNAKSFQRPDTCENFMNGVALMENFDVKTRGENAGTSAIQRAGINLKDLGAADFFEAVGLA